jgi:hypothetical protein
MMPFCAVVSMRLRVFGKAVLAASVSPESA